MRIEVKTLDTHARLGQAFGHDKSAEIMVNMVRSHDVAIYALTTMVNDLQRQVTALNGK